MKNHGLTVILSVLALRPAEAGGGYGNTCQDISIRRVNGFVEIYAQCKQSDEVDAPLKCTELDLNYCYANQGGNIVPKDLGRFQGGCFDCRGDGTSFECLCDTGDSNEPERYSLVDSNDLIENNGGSLKCFGNLGWPCRTYTTL